MRFLYAFLMTGAALGAFYFWYLPSVPMCRMPVAYSIGSFDERFGISRPEAEQALKDAEAVWENALGRDDIFTSADDAPLKVNFIYDERQREADAAASALSDLSVRGEANDVLTELHKKLVAEYQSHEAEYESRRAAYEKNLAAYNADVAKYNAAGGAPEGVYRDLEERKAALDQERQAINSLAAAMNDLIDQINKIGDKGNELISEYNARVHQFNDTYATGDEFTQGDYENRSINVYTFNSEHELVLVLAHELGHALSLNHVDNQASVMYYLMGEQPDPPQLTEEDKAEFNTYCSGSFTHRLLAALERLYNGVIKGDNQSHE